ncbi:MAG: hypothetical protein AAGC93_12025 [Cyanobacteria bacterium P01_F01_bin.53]
MGRKSTPKHPKVQATTAIWSCAVGMLALCIPLVAISGSGVILPLLVMLGAGGGTAAIWLAPEKRHQEDLRLTQTIRSLEERIITLETICTSLSPADEPLSLPKRQDP